MVRWETETGELTPVSFQASWSGVLSSDQQKAASNMAEAEGQHHTHTHQNSHA